LRTMIGGALNIKHGRAHLEEMLRLATSIKQGTVTASLMLRKLGSYLWLRKGGSARLLVPAAMSQTVFVWLLTRHPAASGRVYAAYGGVYVATALVWLRLVDNIKLSVMHRMGAGIALLGMAIIVAGWTGQP